MTIGIDLRPLQGETRFRGIGKSLEFFLDSLADELDCGDSVVFYVDKGLGMPPIPGALSNAKIIKVISSPVGRMRYIRSVMPSYPLLKVYKKDVDVVLQYDAALGIPINVPTVTIFHDLIPYLFRNQEKKLSAEGVRKFKNSLARTMYWQKYLRVLRSYKRSAKIIAISKASRDDLLQFMPTLKPKDVSTIPHGVKLPTISGIISKGVKSFTSTPYLLYVGGIDFRKNVIGLLDAFFKLKPKYPNLKLITVGKEFGLSDQLEDLGWTSLANQHPQYAKDVVQPGYLSEQDLNYLYAHAVAFVFPSRYEGFGMPILEAMAVGCPVIAYKNSSIPEVAGNAALLVNDGGDLTTPIIRLLESRDLRSKLSTAGRNQAKSFTWDKTVKEILTVLRSAVK